MKFKPLVLCLIIMMLSIHVSLAQTWQTDGMAAWHPTNANIIATSNGTTIELRDANLNIIQSRSTGLNNPFFMALSWSPDGSKIALNALPGKILQIWDASTLTLLYEIDNIGGAGMTWRSDSTQFAAEYLGDAESGIAIFNTQSGQVIQKIDYSDRQIEALAWQPNTNIVAFISGFQLAIWDVNNQLVTIPDELLRVSNEIEYSPDGSLLAIEDGISSISILDTTTYELVVSSQDNVVDFVDYFELTWGSGGLISVGNDSITIIWDTSSLTKLGVFRTGMTIKPSWSPDGSAFVASAAPYVTTGTEHVAIVRDAQTGNVLASTVPLPEVTDLVLRNGDTGETLGTLTDGDVVDLSAIGTTNIEIVSIIIGNAGMVVFDVNNSLSDYISEPFVFDEWEAMVGTYSLIATPLSSEYWIGGYAKAITFTVVNEANTNARRTCNR